VEEKATEATGRDENTPEATSGGENTTEGTVRDDDATKTVDLAEIRRQVAEATTGLLQAAALEPGQILVVGCSTSEVIGQRVGTAGSSDVAQAILDGLLDIAAKSGVSLAIQCCEHLNRALVVDEATWRRYDLERVIVIPVPKAGGALAAVAMRRFDRSVVVESIRAHAGMDIGGVLIGMHLRPVAAPVRLSINSVGQARLIMARTRPKLIGGERAVYRLG
jgi:uncharacterized protein (TIGR01440 family)